MDSSGTALEFQSHQPISHKHKVGELACCFICKQGVGVEKAVCCLLCSCYHHKTCLPVQDKTGAQCTSCQDITKVSLSSNTQDLIDILDKSANLVENGVEEGKHSDKDSSVDGVPSEFVG